MATLEWLNSSHQLQYARTPAHTELNKMLVLFLNNLVAGHMMDPQLDTQSLLDMMIAPLVGKHNSGWQAELPATVQLAGCDPEESVKTSVWSGMCNNDPHTVALSSSGLQNRADMHLRNSDYVASGSRLNATAVSFQPKDTMSSKRL